MSLFPAATPDVPGLRYAPDFLEVDEERALLAFVDAQPWLDDLKRRVQHYGYKYDYKARNIDRSMFLGAPPEELMVPARKAIARGLMPDAPPDQVIVNEYEPGQGIVAHIDCVPCFEDFIMTLSLGSACVMDLIHKETRETKPLHFAARAATVFSGPARYEWLHGIRQRKSDEGVARSRRVSLTYRRVKLAR